MAKFKITWEEFEQAAAKHLHHLLTPTPKSVPALIELEGELVEEKKLPPLPEEIDLNHLKGLGLSDDRLGEELVHELLLKVTHIIRYLKARE